MGAIFKTPKMPAIPEPKPLPEPPSYDDEARRKEIAEKRALARVIIKTMNLTNTYGEDELKFQNNK